jgi:hypothetical protein
MDQIRRKTNSRVVLKVWRVRYKNQGGKEKKKKAEGANLEICWPYAPHEQSFDCQIPTRAAHVNHFVLLVLVFIK